MKKIKLNEWNLPAGMKPCNPHGLSAEEITEGGEYRAVTEGDWDEETFILPAFAQVYLSKSKSWSSGTSYNSHFHEVLTFRVPINTPYPKP